MEGLARLVDESLLRNGMRATAERRSLQWSKWFRYESSFSLTLVPSVPGLFALGEELISPGEAAAGQGKRMLAIVEISETSDLGRALAQLSAPGSRFCSRLESGRCFIRYALLPDEGQRREALLSLQRWLTSSAEAASGFPADFSQSAASPLVAHSNPAPRRLLEPEADARPGISPPAPLPSGF
jgi:hypothetical protein